MPEPCAVTDSPPAASYFASLGRRAGVLLHPTSLPNGVLDDEVERFLDWMQSAGLRVWQMLPLGPPLVGLSPYQTCSTHALNPALLPLEALDSAIDEGGFAAFCAAQEHWLSDYCLFILLHELEDQRCWSQWPENYRSRQPEALAQLWRSYPQQLQALQRQQYLLWRRWQQIRTRAAERDILLLGDVPIAVAYDSADVWAAPELFKLDEQFQPTVVAGVPPDYFSETGQRWGNPHYDWQRMQADGFRWWRSRIKTALSQCDLLRIDHFRGLEALWEIPAEEETAMVGAWVKTPGAELLTAIQQDFPGLPLVAEDLGVITPEVTALRDQFGLPGLSVLQFGFDGLPDNPHSLSCQVENSLVYTGTHDNNTSCGWFAELDQGWQQQILAALPDGDAAMPWPLIAAALQSPAKLALVPMQDWLSLGSEQRTNTPGTTTGNWCWRFSWSQLPDGLAEQIRNQVAQGQRLSSAG